MSVKKPILIMDVDGTLFPVGLTQEQVHLFERFVAGANVVGELAVLDKTPIGDMNEITERIENDYQIKLV